MALNAFVAGLFPSLLHNSRCPHRHHVVLAAALFRSRHLWLRRSGLHISLPHQSHWESLKSSRARHAESHLLGACEDLERRNRGIFGDNLTKLCRSARGEATGREIERHVYEHLREWDRIDLQAITEGQWVEIAENFADLHSANDDVKSIVAEIDPLMDGLLPAGRGLFIGPVRQNLPRLNSLATKLRYFDVLDTSEDVGNSTASKLLLWLTSFSGTVKLSDASNTYPFVYSAITSARGDRQSVNEVARSREQIEASLGLVDTAGKVFTVLPDGFLAGDGHEMLIRKQLLAEGVVDSVIRLPSTLRKRTATSPSLLILKKQSVQSQRPITFIDPLYNYGGGTPLQDTWVRNVLSLYNGEAVSNRSDVVFHMQIDAEVVKAQKISSLDVVDYYQPPTVLDRSDFAEHGNLEKVIARRNRLEGDIRELLKKYSAR